MRRLLIVHRTIAGHGTAGSLPSLLVLSASARSSSSRICCARLSPWPSCRRVAHSSCSQHPRCRSLPTAPGQWSGARCGGSRWCSACTCHPTTSISGRAVCGPPSRSIRAGPSPLGVIRRTLSQLAMAAPPRSPRSGSRSGRRAPPSAAGRCSARPPLPVPGSARRAAQAAESAPTPRPAQRPRSPPAAAALTSSLPPIAASPGSIPCAAPPARAGAAPAALVPRTCPPTAARSAPPPR